MKVRPFLAAAALAAGLIGGAQGGQAAFAGPASPAAASTPALFLQSCTGNSFCLATGTLSKPGHGPSSFFIEEWNGKTWRIVPHPSGFAGDVTCGTPTFCLAAGSTPKDRSAEFEWNGKAWRRFGAQPPDSEIDCLSARFCVTLTGEQFFNTEFYWTGGATWSEMPESGTGCGGAWCQITDFGCASATNCWDSGDYCGDSDCDNGTFDWNDLWTGKIWTDDTDTAFGVGQACAGRSFCMDLQLPSSALMSDDWGATWQNASVHLAASCGKLATCTFPTRAVCASTRFCMALPGQDPTGALVWNGAKWGIARLALVGGHLPKLVELSCGSSTNCVATGTYQVTPRSTPKPIAEHWNGKAWKVTKVVIP
jgi:hypothetical protein